MPNNKKIAAAKTIANFFEAELEKKKDDKLALIGLAFAEKDIYEAYAELAGLTGVDGAEASGAETVDGEDIIMNIGKHKRRSMSAFERLAIKHPDYALAHFYLGYFYLNLGLYKKADLAWAEFGKRAEGDELFWENKNASELIGEARERRAELEDPVRIEEGENLVRSGKHEDGARILEPYLDNPKMEKYWPLFYHLALAKRAMGENEAALKLVKKGLTQKPLSAAMLNLIIAIYEDEGDSEMAEKYRYKLRLALAPAENE